MGWLEERIIQHLYSNGEDQIVIEAKACDDPPPPPDGYVYKGFAPDKMNLMTKVQYEQNGRVAYRIDIGDGKFIHRSATRERYERQIGNTAGADNARKTEQKSVYTKAYAEAVEKKKKENLAMHERNLKKIISGGK